jgi:hypothetical protein
MLLPLATLSMQLLDWDGKRGQNIQDVGDIVTGTRVQCLPKFNKYKKDHHNASYKQLLTCCIMLLGLVIPIFLMCLAKYFFFYQSEIS